MAHFHHRLLTDITEALHDNTIPGIRDPQAFVVSFFPKRKKAGEDLQVQHSTTICRGYRTSVRTFQHTTVLIGYEMGLLCTQLWPVRKRQARGLDPQLDLLHSGMQAHTSLQPVSWRSRTHPGRAARVGSCILPCPSHLRSCIVAKWHRRHEGHGREVMGGKELTSAWCSGRFSPASR